MKANVSMLVKLVVGGVKEGFYISLSGDRLLVQLRSATYLNEVTLTRNRVARTVRKDRATCVATVKDSERFAQLSAEQVAEQLQKAFTFEAVGSVSGANVEADDRNRDSDYGGGFGRDDDDRYRYSSYYDSPRL